MLDFDLSYLKLINCNQVFVITDSTPDLGRLRAILTHGPNEYALDGRAWSGPWSYALNSYGVFLNNSLKGSHRIIIVDPNASWQRAEIVIKGSHFGTGPYNFQVIHISTMFNHSLTRDN